jgi:site-specific DNA-methyltransferase (adenine-specific)
MYCLSIFDNVKYNLNFLVTMKKCKECKRPITNPRNSLQVVCSDSTDTAIAYSTCYAQPFDTVIHGDFLTNNLPDKCANLIIADPPYFEVKGAFDFVWNSFEDYLKDVEKWAIECKRLLADNGTLFWWGMDRKIAYAQVIFDKHFQLLSTLVWEKPSIANEWNTRRTFPERGQERLLMYANDFDINALGNIYDDPNNFTEIKQYLRNEKTASGLKSDWFVSVSSTYCSHYFALTSQWAFPTEKDYKSFQTSGYFQKPYEELKQQYEELKQQYEELKQQYESQRRPFNNDLQLTDVLRFSRVHNASHPTEKPEKLTRALILTCSRKNDLVVVPFAGSGTEVAISVKEGRKAIGFDIEKKYVDMSNKRIKTFKDAPSLF